MSEDKSKVNETENKKNELNESDLDKAVGGGRLSQMTPGAVPVPGTPIQGS